MISPAYESFVNDVIYDNYKKYEAAEEGIIGGILLGILAAPFILITGICMFMQVYIKVDELKHKPEIKNTKNVFNAIKSEYQNAAKKAYNDTSIMKELNAEVLKMIKVQLSKNNALAKKYNLTENDFEINNVLLPATFNIPKSFGIGGIMSLRNDKIYSGNGNTGTVIENSFVGVVSSLKVSTLSRFDDKDIKAAKKFVGIIAYNPIKQEISKKMGYTDDIPENVISDEKYNDYINKIKKNKNLAKSSNDEDSGFAKEWINDKNNYDYMISACKKEALKEYNDSDQVDIPSKISANDIEIKNTSYSSNNMYCAIFRLTDPCVNRIKRNSDYSWIDNDTYNVAVWFDVPTKEVKNAELIE